MLGLKLRDEFLGNHTPGTMIQLRDDSGTGAAERDAAYILSITYPTADVQTALKNVAEGRPGKPIVLMGDRGRGKSHIMAVTHHAISSPDTVENWAQEWGRRIGAAAFESIKLPRGFVPISEPVHNHEFKFLWDLIFDRHPKGEYFRGRFANAGQPFPPRSLLVEMFAAQPTVLILDEFQKWFDGLSDEKGKSGVKYRTYAENFIQNLSELARDRPDILILIVSVLNNDTEAFRQIHRNTPVLVDFRGPTATQDRRNLMLHRLFENRQTFSEAQIQSAVAVYAAERFRLRFPEQSDADRAHRTAEVVACFPFSPELLELLDNQILMAAAAQETRDLIRILAFVYRGRGDFTPLITPADFFVDDDACGVQSLLDSIATAGEQEKLREIAQHNLQTVKAAVGDAVPQARELISALWMRSMAPGNSPGGTRNELHLDITRATAIDDNAFSAEIAAMVENSINVHGEQTPGGRFFFKLEENPRSKVRATARNNKLWEKATDTSMMVHATYPGKDLEHIRATVRSVMEVATQQATSRIIVLGPDWRDTPWEELDDADHPRKWTQPVLLVFPEAPAIGGGETIPELGKWLKTHVPVRRNTVRLLLPQASSPCLYTDQDILFKARCSHLVGQAWKDDGKYRLLKNDFDRPFRELLQKHFDRFAVLRTWDFQHPEMCTFAIEKVAATGHDIPNAVESGILTGLFDFADFENLMVARAGEHFLVGDVLDELAEPPSAAGAECLPFLGDIHIFERILEVVAKGRIVLNADGAWIAPLAEHESYASALPYIRSRASKFMHDQAMRKTQLGLPNEVGGAVIPGPKPQPSAPAPSPIPSPIQPLPPIVPAGGVPGFVPDPGSDGVMAVPETGLATQGSGTAATGINLMKSLEDWGLKPNQQIESLTLEFGQLTVQQARQLLQRLPSTMQAVLRVAYEEES